MNGPEELEILGPDDRDVDGVRDQPALERRYHLLRDDQPRAVLRLLGRRGQVRRHDDVLELQQLARVRLRREDVERGACDLALAHRGGERLLVDELPARRVHDPHARPHPLDRGRVHEPARLLREREVQREEVGRRQHRLGRLDVLGAQLAEALRRDEGVVRDDPHPEPERAARDLPADAAEAEHAERLVRKFDPAPARALPAPVLERGVRLRDVARERDEQADRVLGGRDDRRLRRVRHHDPAPRRRVHVDVVDPDPRPPDHLQALGARDHIRGELRPRADDDRVVLADDLLER